MQIMSSVAAKYRETVTLPAAVRFPVELRAPEGFDADALETWPRVSGRLEFVDGKLLYMPPCGDVQQDTVTDVVIALGSWVRAHKDFVLGSNEAGMRLAGATRAADAAIWRRADLGRRTGGLWRVPPVLVVEVAGDEEPEAVLRDKARWYLDAGVEVVWLVLPETRHVVGLTGDHEVRCAGAEAVPSHASLPGLAPRASDLFVQISEA
jgi:Uma2 family endonuclease